MCMLHRVQNMDLGTEAPSKDHPPPPGQTQWDFRKKRGSSGGDRKGHSHVHVKPNIKEGLIPLVHQPQARTPSPFYLFLQSEHISSPFCHLPFPASPAFYLCNVVHRGFSFSFGGSSHMNPPTWTEEMSSVSKLEPSLVPFPNNV